MTSAKALQSAFPFRALVNSRIVRNQSVWMMLFFALGPLVEFSLSPGEQGIVLFLVVYFAVAWCTFLYVFAFHRAVSLTFGLTAAAFSLLVGYPLDLLLAHVPPLSWLYHLLSAPTAVERFAGYVFGVGIEEELIKSIPVMLLAFALGRVKKPSDAMFCSVLSGFGFAINESSKYITGMHNPLGILGQTLLRTATMPFLHGAWTAASGYFIALAIVKKGNAMKLPTVGIVLAAIVHGCFDGAPDGLPTIAAGLLAFSLFVAYVARAEEMSCDSTLAETHIQTALAGAGVREVAVGLEGTVQ